MADIIYEISFTPPAGSYGTLIEYRERQTSAWITPSSPGNPTTLDTYELTLDAAKTYVVRVSSEGINCTKKYSYITIQGDEACFTCTEYQAHNTSSESQILYYGLCFYEGATSFDTHELSPGETYDFCACFGSPYAYTLDVIVTEIGPC